MGFTIIAAERSQAGRRKLPPSSPAEIPQHILDLATQASVQARGVLAASRQEDAEVRFMRLCRQSTQVGSCRWDSQQVGYVVRLKRGGRLLVRFAVQPGPVLSAQVEWAAG